MFSFPEAARILSVRLIHADPACRIQGASIDTRTLKPADLFVAFKGERDDGHRHLGEAFQKHAAGALIDQKFFELKHPHLAARPEFFRNLLPVPSPEKALSRLASRIRSRCSGLAAVGVTGSVGKTTTKEFLSFLLKRKYPVLANQGNFNNHLGLPLTLFRLQEDDRFCVAELGANHAGEIRALAGILKPTAGVITCIAPAHLEGFGSLGKIVEAKLELAEALPRGAPLILPDDDPVLFQKAKQFQLNRIRVGESACADYRLGGIRILDSRVYFTVNGKGPFAFPGIAGFLAQNAAMAVAAAETLGLSLEDIPPAWDGLALPAGRFQEQIFAGIRVIHDGYNANPFSFEKALEAFSALETEGRKILVFADMLELGREETKWHEALGRLIARARLDYAAAYGPRSRTSIEVLRRETPALNADHFPGVEDLGVFLKSWVRPGDTVLLKASRGMRIERLVPAFLEERVPEPLAKH